MTENQPLIIKEWPNGIGDSPNAGVGLLRNVSIDTLTGAIVPNYVPAKLSPVSSSDTFTVNTGTDIGTVTTAFAAMANYVAVTFSTTTTLPAPLVAGTIYFLIKVTATTFKIATSMQNAVSGTAVDLTTTGTGTHTMTTVDPGTIASISTIYEPDVFNGGLPNKVVFYNDSNGRVWCWDHINADRFYLIPGNTLTNGNGKGLVGFVAAGSAKFLFVLRDASVDVCNISNEGRRLDPVGTSSWTNAWKALNMVAGTAGSHHAIVGQDNLVYFCDGQYVGSIQQIPGSTFDPATPGTYTYNNQALSLPQAEQAQWLEELGINLLAAGGTYNFIYPWDRSAVSFGLPIVCAERNVYRLKNINNTVFILCGQRGNIYKTQGSVVVLARKLPEYVVGNGSASQVVWGGISSKSGNLVFGVTAANNSANSGIYMMYPDGRLVIENQPSSGAGAVGAIESNVTEFYTFGSAGAVDLVSVSRYTGFGAVFQSELYSVGTETKKAGFSQLELQLDQPTSGSSSVVRISYREKLAGSFTTLATFTTDAVNSSFVQDVGLTSLQNIQVQMEMTGSGSNTDALAPFEIRLYP